jgi:DNA-binding beta-propeller fold protein YncE
MSLELLGHVDLPGNLKPGGFDHAAVHCASSRLYVAHTANDALDVIDCVHDRYLHSIPNLSAVAGALVSDEKHLVFTSNRGENTVGIFAPDNEEDLAKIGVGIRPNGLAYDPSKDLLLAANVGDPDIPNSFTGSDEVLKQLELSGPPDVIFFNRVLRHLYVAIGDPGVVEVFDIDLMDRIETVQTERGAHTLGFDAERNKLYAFLPETHRAAVYTDKG